MSMTRDELRDSARQAFGSDGLAPDAVASWTNLSDMGWFMMTVPEARGGLGLTSDAAAVIHYELGRALVPGSAIAQMLTVEALTLAPPTDAVEALLADAIAGKRMTASLNPVGSASIACVPDADLASHVLIAAPGRVTLCPIANVTHRATWDETRRLFDVSAGDGLTLAEGAAADAINERLQVSLSLALAADSLGAADAVLAMTIDYLKTRQQFDRPIALFQALKHRVADMRTWLSGAEALLWSRAGGAVDAQAAGAVKSLATTTSRRIAEEAVQLHGGIGLTAEYPCHLFLKRIFLNGALGGDADHWDELTGRAALAKAG